jgi:hypothetical protein
VLPSYIWMTFEMLLMVVIPLVLVSGEELKTPLSSDTFR